MITVQDLRDIQGDLQIGRSTLPIVMGEIPSRVLIALAFVTAPILTHVFLFVPAGLTGDAIICETILGALCLIIAVRAIALRSKVADHRTYMLFTYWYVALLASAIVVM
jgi:4-hydroxybenzoate polyprenyltransferase